MTQPRRPTDRRLFLRRSGALASAALVGLLASACGFEPVYTAQRTNAGIVGPTADLYAIRVVPIADREGQLLHNMLLDRLNPNGRPGRPLYELSTLVDISVSNLGVLADATSSRARVRVQASSTLTGAGDPHLFEAEAVSSFNITESDYASVAAEDAAIERSLATIADKLTLQLAAFFRKARAQEGAAGG